MSKLVYKYPIPLKSQKFSLMLPVGWKFLQVVYQNELPYLWAEVKDGTAKEEVKFSLYGTGQEIPDTAEYLTTYSVGPFVIHMYKM